MKLSGGPLDGREFALPTKRCEIVDSTGLAHVYEDTGDGLRFVTSYVPPVVRMDDYRPNRKATARKREKVARVADALVAG